MAEGIALILFVIIVNRFVLNLHQGARDQVLTTADTLPEMRFSDPSFGNIGQPVSQPADDDDLDGVADEFGAERVRKAATREPGLDTTRGQQDSPGGSEV